MNSKNTILASFGVLLAGLFLAVQACKPRTPSPVLPLNTPTPSEASLARNQIIVAEADSNSAAVAGTTHIVLKNIGVSSVNIEDWWLLYRNTSATMTSFRLDSDNSSGGAAVFNWGDDTTLDPGETLTVHLRETNVTPPVDSVYANASAAVSNLALAARGGQIGLYTDGAATPFTDSSFMVDYLTYGVCFSPVGFGDYQGIGVAAGQWNTFVMSCKSPTPTRTPSHTPVIPTATPTNTPAPVNTPTPCIPETSACDFINVFGLPAGSTIQNGVTNPALLQNNALDWVVAPKTALVF